MIKNVKYILTGVFFYTCEIYAQTLGVVKGVVKDKSNNESLPGAVVVLDKTKGVAADLEGVFYINTTEGSHTLDCDLVGYKKYTETNGKPPKRIFYTEYIFSKFHQTK